MSYKDIPANAIRARQDGVPEAMMTWVRLPGGRIRLYASRSLDDVAWGQRTREKDSSVVWHLDGDMENVLVVDRDTAGEALEWVLTRWAREDAEAERRKLAFREVSRAIGPAGT